MKERSATVSLALLLTVGAIVAMPPPNLVASNPSPNQVCWNSPSNPILNYSGAYIASFSTTGKWFIYNNSYSQPTVLLVGNTYYMWFDGHLNGIPGLYRATSHNGVNWTVNSTKVLTSGVNGSWDFSGPYGPSVVWNGTRYLMYFWGDNGNIRTRSIGVATSRDGVHWIEYSNNPIMKPGPAYYDGGYIKDPNVVFSNNSYTMWYKGRSPFGNSTFVVSIDVATSRDGIHWTKYQSNPVMGYTNSSSFQKNLIFEKPSVVKIGGGYLMAADDGTQIGYASSSDGFHWKIANSLLVRPTNDTAWSGAQVVGPALIVNGTTLLLWYVGTSPITGQASPYKSGIGFAECALLVFQSNITLTQTATRISTETISTSSIRTVTTSFETTVGASNAIEVTSAAVLVGFGGAIAALFLARRVIKR